MIISFQKISEDVKKKLTKNLLAFSAKYDSRDHSKNLLYSFQPEDIREECLSQKEFKLAREKRFPKDTWKQIYVLNRKIVGSYFCELCKPSNLNFFTKDKSGVAATILKMDNIDFYLELIDLLKEIFDYIDAKRNAFEAIKYSTNPDNSTFKKAELSKILLESAEKIRENKEIVLHPIQYSNEK